MSNLLRCSVLCGVLLAGSATAGAQNIRGHYVSQAEQDGTIYHTFPRTLFQSREFGALTFDITYKEHRQEIATINFTYVMPRMTPADSVRVTVGGRSILSGPVSKLFVEPGRKMWTHRYSFAVPVGALYTFFDETALPELTLYSGGRAYVYPAKRSAWRSYAPVGFRIFEMIRLNEGN